MTGGGGLPKVEIGARGFAGWLCANGFRVAPDFGANRGDDEGAGAGVSAAGAGADWDANADSACVPAGCCGAKVCIGGAPKGAGEKGSTRFTCPAGPPGWMTKALLEGAAARGAASTGGWLPNAEGLAGAAVAFVRA